MRVLVRCDATAAQGAGRLVRAVAVAEALTRRGHEAVLSAAITEPWTLELVDEAKLAVLPPVETARELLALARDRGADLVHLDGPAPADLGAVFGDGPPLLSAVEDSPGAAATTLALAVRPSLVGAVDGGSAAPAGNGRLTVAGPHYAPVRAAVLAARQRRQWRAGGMGDRLRVLVHLGAAPEAEQLLPAVQALVHSDVNADVLAVAATQLAGIRAESLSSRSVRVLATGHRADLPRLVADHDLVVTRPGRLLWEVSCIGTPMALLALTDADDARAADWVRAEVAVGLGRPASATANQFRALLRDGMRRASMSTAGQRLVDGAGAERVVDLMESVVRG